VKVPIWEWSKMLLVPVGTFFLIALGGILWAIDQTFLAVIWLVYSVGMGALLYRKIR
jgi:hypothetical protein